MFRKAYILPKNDQLNEILDGTYDEVLGLLKMKKPTATQLSDDEDFSQLHYLFALVKMGYLRVFQEDRSQMTIFEVATEN